MASLGRSINHFPVHPGAQKLASTSPRRLRLRKPVAFLEYDSKRCYRRLHYALADTGTVESKHWPPAQTKSDRFLLLRVLVSESVQRQVRLIADIQTTMIA